MKKILVMTLVLLLVFSLGACANRTPAPTPTPTPTTPAPTPTAPAPTTPAVNWKDGTYEGVGDKWQFGNENATVVISSGKISQVTLRRLTTEGQEVNYEEWTGKEVGGKVQPNLKQFREDLAQAIIAKQSTAVDDIAGATVSSKNWKIAVDRALEQAEAK